MVTPPGDRLCLWHGWTTRCLLPGNYRTCSLPAGDVPEFEGFRQVDPGRTDMGQFSSAAGYADPFSEDPSVQAVVTPLWRESMFGFDWLALRSSPVYYGCGVERGNGEP